MSSCHALLLQRDLPDRIRQVQLGLCAPASVRVKAAARLNGGILCDSVDFRAFAAAIFRRTMQEGRVAESGRGEAAPPVDGSRVMLARQRQAFILERVREDGAVRVADLVRELGVSDMTVRRDLEVLDDRGLLEKVHGGATVARRDRRCSSRGSRPSRLSSRPRRTPSPTAAVGPRRAGHGDRASRPGRRRTRLPSGSSTCPGLTVVTNSIRVADVLHQVGRPDQTIILTGGVRTPSEALVGPFAVAALRTVHVDLVFMGVHGMDPHSGFTCPNLLEADTDRALIEAGRRLVVVADHTKWGVIGISSIARLDQADVLITDRGISSRRRAPDARARRPRARRRRSRRDRAGPPIDVG